MYGVKVPQPAEGQVTSQLSTFIAWLIALIKAYLAAHVAAGKAPAGSQLSVALQWLLDTIRAWDWTHLGAQFALPIIEYLQTEVVPDLIAQGGVYLLIAPVITSLLAAAKEWAEAELAKAKGAG